MLLRGWEVSEYGGLAPASGSWSWGQRLSLTYVWITKPIVCDYSCSYCFLNLWEPILPGAPKPYAASLVYSEEYASRLGRDSDGVNSVNMACIWKQFESDTANQGTGNPCFGATSVTPTPVDSGPCCQCGGPKASISLHAPRSPAHK